jgi:hypothetical protein
VEYHFSYIFVARRYSSNVRTEKSAYEKLTFVVLGYVPVICFASSEEFGF